MSDKHRRVNLRTEIVRAAENASVPLDDFERALILGQIAGLLAAHPKVGGKVAFKGGVIMNLIDGSPRLSRDLDGVLATGGRVTEATIREALSTTEAQKVVKRNTRVLRRANDLGPQVDSPVFVAHRLARRMLSGGRGRNNRHVVFWTLSPARRVTPS